MEDGAEGLAEQLSGAGWLPTPSRPPPCIHTHTHSCVSKELLRPGPWGGEGWANPIHTPRFSAEHEAKATRGFFLTSAFSGRHHHHPCLQFCWKQRHRLQSKAGAELWAEGKVVPRLLSKWVQRVSWRPLPRARALATSICLKPPWTLLLPLGGDVVRVATRFVTQTRTWPRADVAWGRRGGIGRDQVSLHTGTGWPTGNSAPIGKSKRQGNPGTGLCCQFTQVLTCPPSSQGGRGAPGRTRANLAASSSPTSSL